MATMDLTDVAAGDELPVLAQTATLETSVAYAGASTDLNPLHYDADVAADISPTGGIIAHGMYSMGLVSRLVTDWAGGPEHLAALDVRFTRPWPLGTEATFGGTVKEVGEDTVTVSLWGRDADGKAMLRGSASLRR
ncbi:MaoC/PaaZ C-terminal domain-containing protein [Salsipaludibacter albus]|uniref:MaoC/PaaZ C-terminal domain-containing protein n=1 Tax=Salsipaludibacter albus TaxID=2849650 RepID=UPI001EE42D64|nr:MaoC/PaaZ C-terminal domain-containing protein [Salsipaludibacter albus]MBY5161537.1 dehydratase [Salsipaludibacter albus]